MFYGVPASGISPSDPTGFSGPSSSSLLVSWLYPSRSPFVTHINMRTPQDSLAYVDKLANFGSNYSLGKLIISPNATNGYADTNYYFDDVRVERYAFDPFFIGGSNGRFHFFWIIKKIYVLVV